MKDLRSKADTLDDGLHEDVILQERVARLFPHEKMRAQDFDKGE